MLSSLGSFKMMSLGFLGFGGLSCRGWTWPGRVCAAEGAALPCAMSGAQRDMSLTKGCLRLQQPSQQMHLELGRQIGSNCEVRLQPSEVILCFAPDLQVVKV